MEHPLFSKLGLPPMEMAAEPQPVLTLYQRERALAGMREAFGAWLNVEGLDVIVALTDEELPRVPAPETIYLFYSPADGESLVQLRSLLNRLKRLHVQRRIFLFDTTTVSSVLKTILLGDTGSGAFVQHGKITARLHGRHDFEAFREIVSA